MRLSQKQRWGLEWEYWALEQLHARGHTDARLVSNYFSDRDIMLGSMPIEIKAARPHHHWTNCLRTRWQFDVARVPKNFDSVVILVAVDSQEQPHPFIVPSWLCWNRYNIHITSHPTKYRGLFAFCLNNWANVELVQAIHAKYNGQGPLFKMGTGDNLSKSLNGDTFQAQPLDPKTCPHFPIGVTL